jgi:hypothetical protein
MTAPTRSQPMTDQDRLERILSHWERYPSVMLSGAGANTAGKAAALIRAKIASLESELAGCRACRKTVSCVSRDDDRKDTEK